MRRSLARLASATAAFASLAGCSSASLSVAAPIDGDASVDAPIDAGAPPDEASTDAADSCPATAGVASFCIAINPAPSHPPYGTAQANALALDGLGVVIVALYDVDPVANPSAAPVATLRYPSADQVGKTIDVDTELSTTLTGTVTDPGSYWVVAVFQDNPVARTGSTTTLPGDFLLTPTVDSSKQLVFPSFDLAVGTASKLTITLQPYRQVDVTLNADASAVLAAKTNPTIHGDGPALLALYDGDIATAPILSESASTGCIDLQLQAPTPPMNVLSHFGAYVSGEHRALIALFDYTDTPFPGKGTLTTPYLVAANAPKIFVDPSLWISQGQATLDLGTTYAPTDTPTDTLTCAVTMTAGDPRVRARARR